MKSIAAKVLGLLALAAGCWGAVAPSNCQLKLLGFQFNTQLIIQMWNAAQQTNGTINNFPANVDPGVFSMTVQNPTSQDQYVYIKISISDPGDPNGNPIATGCPVTSLIPVKANSTATLFANNFQAAGFSGTFNENYTNQNFQNMSPSKVSQFLTRKFVVCLYLMDGSDCRSSCSQDCEPFSVMLGSPGANTAGPIPIYPNDMNVPGFPLFSWTPATSSTLKPEQISYRLLLMEQPQGVPLFQKDLPAFTTSYQMTAQDGGAGGLTKGRKYYWAVQAIDPGGNPLGGSNVLSAANERWFVVQAGAGADLGSALQRLARESLPFLSDPLRGMIESGKAVPVSVTLDNGGDASGVANDPDYVVVGASLK